jgi:hypothetical protein
MITLTTSERESLEKWLEVQKRPLECRDGVPMRHEDIARDENENAILRKRTQKALQWLPPCDKGHAGCPHLLQGKENLEGVKSVVIEVLTRIRETELFNAINAIEK